ncbi:MAG: SLC13 family permease [Rhodospirillales bacterium]|nr:SLC13 family permease [Rhodospirillales bacterium]MBT4040559.1 SLC13 family permease [Rhodospirillales bacterium]MBT4627004.1 SLC13 family permease [Rhodospirillales bacterium]MBT5352237.1 SLC13 family permease [Rhodospirillales bacterium]MBT5520621.1 SLC13 family permease [Rhodospirillales bacterium]
MEAVFSSHGSEFQMWVTFILIIGAFALYVVETTTMEMVSVGLICILLVFFNFFPVTDTVGNNLVDPGRILHGFSNPALITVLALLVVGQGMVRTGVLDHGARVILNIAKGRLGAVLALMFSLIIVIVTSAFLNNIPVVVIFIPIMQALAARFGQSPSKWMIPLSYAAVFGGMTTLIGSGTNLLVNSALIEMGETPFGFFDFTVSGLVLAGAGLLYITFIAPRLLPDREAVASQTGSREGKHFLAQITVGESAKIMGDLAVGGIFRGLPNMTVRMIQRGKEILLPPYEDVRIRPDDILVVAAVRKPLREALAADPALFHPDLGDGSREDNAGNQPWEEGEQVLAEVMVVPASRFVGQTLAQIGFRYKTNCIVLGIQRRSRMIRGKITDIRIQSGDVLLIQGQPIDVSGLRNNRDVVLIEWSTEELPSLDHAKRALIIFSAVVFFAATGILPIVVSALCGAAAMVVMGVLNVDQAFRALDSKIVTTIATALALGVALQETGGAAYLAHSLVVLVEGQSPTVVLSLFFILVAVLANIISTKACAVLFTPIAVDLAREIGVPPESFALAIVFAANCSFASPLGYQTNLLVIAPGNYRFVDFSRAGVPLVVLMWIVFTLFVPWYYGL